MLHPRGLVVLPVGVLGRLQWPYCYESQIFDKNFGGSFDCSKTEIPAYTFTAHMAPLGLAFYQKGSLPERYAHSVFIAFHGSWNRSIPAGYKVVRLKLDSLGNIITHEDFITGWLRKDGSPDGRPVDLELSPEGDLYLSDDYLGVVYKNIGLFRTVAVLSHEFSASCVIDTGIDCENP